jgi:tetratricopeptide (TPR) repeat protein
VYYILQGRYDAALHQLEGAKTSGASPAEVESLRGLAVMLGGDPVKAIPIFDHALTLKPDFQEARLNRGIAYLRAGQYPKAIADLEAIANDEHSTLRAQAAYHNAIALDRAGRSADAEKWLDRALTLDPKLDASLLYLGMLRERNGDLQGAGRAFFEYLKAHPDSTVAMLRFGIVAVKAGRADAGKTYLEKVIKQNPNSDEATEARKFLVMWE